MEDTGNEDEGRANKKEKLTVTAPDEPEFMDPKLWGDLQSHIDLAYKIFAKLPLREFFQLRLVCKDWNRLAGDRKFLETSNPKPIPKPYFHMFRRGCNFELHGLLTYTSWLKKWSYTCLGHYNDLDSMVAVEGMIYFHNADNPKVQRVFNLHSRVWYTLPPLEPWVQSFYDGEYRPVVAMKVDTSTHPYEFQVIRTGGGAPTQIYDSRSKKWHLSDASTIEVSSYKATCAQVSNAVYVRSELEEVFCYKINEDIWWEFNAPPGENTYENYLCGVGAWKEKVYHLSPVREREFTDDIYELIMYVEEDLKLDWKEFDRMPSHLRDLLADHSLDFEILSSYCDALVLIYNFLLEEGEVRHFVLYNLETKEWKRGNIPNGLVQPFMDDEETATFWEATHCYRRKKGRNLLSESDSESQA